MLTLLWLRIARKTSHTFTDAVAFEGAGVEWIAKLMLRDVRKYGYHGRVAFRTDGEPAILDFMGELLATPFFRLAKSDFCVSGRLSSELADFAALLLAASGTGRATFDPADCAVSFLRIIHSHFCSSSRCTTMRSFVPFCRLRALESAKARCHVALLRKRDPGF